VKLHDLKPAPGSRKERRRVGRGIAAGQGKTAGRGTKGQKARAGGTIPAWFEGGQTPLHQRIPKLRGFVNKFKIAYEVVNLGDIARLVELGELEGGEMPGTKPSKGKAPITVNQEILRAAGLVRRLDRPMKVLGGGALSTALFVVADAFSASARSKIEAAGGTVSVLEVPTERREALGLDDDHDDHADDNGSEPAAIAEPVAEAPDAAASATEGAPAEAAADEAPPAKQARAPKAKAAKADAEASADAPAADAPAASTETKPAKPRTPRKPKTAEADAAE
jgi:large subunit ribosomal protein L15